jgi:hypothetical protein
MNQYSGSISRLWSPMRIPNVVKVNANMPSARRYVQSSSSMQQTLKINRSL